MLQTSHAREPKQDRSRASFERLLDAAAALLAERGYSDFTIAEVSKRSKVSVGSIYGRFENKDALVRATQERVLARMDQEYAGLVNKLRRKRLPLSALVTTGVKELAQFHRRHANELIPFMDRASSDPVIATVGKKAHAQMALDFKLLLLERRNEILHPDPERAASTCFAVIYATLARHLGLGSAKDVVGEGDWRQLVQDLGQMSLTFLLAKRAQVTSEDSD